MKRISVILCALLLSVSLLGVAIAEGIDYTSLSLEDLITMRDDISREINQRVASSSDALIPGEYLVGRDIAPGAYTVTCLKGGYADGAQSLAGKVGNVIGNLSDLIGESATEVAGSTIDSLATKHMLVGVFTQGEGYETCRNDISPDDAFLAYAETSHALEEGESVVISLEEGQYLIVRHGEGTCLPFKAAYSVE